MAEPPDTARAAVVAAVASSLLAQDLLDAPRRIARGYGNENWIVALNDRSVILKIAGDRADIGKLRAAWDAQGLAQRGGVPTGRPICFLERCDELDSRPVRVLEYVEGVQPEGVLSSPGAVATFFASLGRTIELLHGIALPAFSSRVDGSAPAFDRWSDYVEYRLAGVIERALGAAVFSEGELRALVAHVGPLASRVSPVVAPALTHRDLYLDNLLAGPDGDVRALLDWDTAEAWDPVVDLVKLRWQVFDAYPGSSDAFWRAYRRGGAPIAMLRERLYVVDVLELVNTISNARLAGWADFEERSRLRLRAAVDDFGA
jgi:aminoglycoside phosphotransferase (APT) family kinase protein